MEKQDFSEAGVQLLLDQLYALPNNQLEAEALAALSDVSAWLKAHFLFSSSQEEFLDGMSPVFLQEAATQISYFIAGRLPISLVRFTSSASTEFQAKDRGKLVDLDRQRVTTYSPTLGTVTFESLIFSIGHYQEMN